VRRRALVVLVGACCLGLAGLCIAEEARSSRLSGRVIDGNQRPIAGASVELFLDDVEAERRHYELKQQVATDADGGFEFPHLAEGWYLIVAKHDGFAQTFRYFVLEAGASQKHTFVVRKPITADIILRDEEGQPIEGARLRSLTPRDETGEFWIRRRDEWEQFGLAVPPSDAAGRLQLPPLPDDSTLNAIIEHDEFAPVAVKDLKVKSGKTGEATMKRGVALSLAISPSYEGDRVSEVEIDLRHNPFDHPSTIIWHELPVNDRGQARLTVEPGRYNYLSLKHPQYVITPLYETRIGKQEFMQLGKDGRQNFSFVLHKKIKVSGRVVDSEGQPVKGAYILGEVPNKGPNDDRRHLASEWMIADFAETDDDGNYSLQLAAGPVRITHQGQSEDGQGFISEPSELAFVVSRDGSTIAPDVTLRPMPKIRGQVIDSEGQPVEKAVVRLRGDLRWMQPVATDAEGRFELAPPFIPKNLDADEDRPDQPLVAFHPYERLAGRVTVRLTDLADSLNDVTITLEPETPGWLFSDFQDELTPFEKGKIDSDRSGELSKLSPIGVAAPLLEGAWLNVEGPPQGLDAFAGKFVLLDFWFIGCGPCHADLPSVKLFHELYADRGASVVSVHDNSALPDAVRDHAEHEHLSFPILVDEPDGRTVRRYEDHGLHGFPNYVLVGPDGKVIDDDDTSPGPSLRTYKIELIRERLLGAKE